MAKAGGCHSHDRVTSRKTVLPTHPAWSRLAGWKESSQAGKSTGQEAVGSFQARRAADSQQERGALGPTGTRM